MIFVQTSDNRRRVEVLKNNKILYPTFYEFYRIVKRILYNFI